MDRCPVCSHPLEVDREGDEVCADRFGFVRTGPRHRAGRGLRNRGDFLPKGGQSCQGDLGIKEMSGVCPFTCTGTFTGRTWLGYPPIPVNPPDLLIEQAFYDSLAFPVWEKYTVARVGDSVAYRLHFPPSLQKGRLRSRARSRARDSCRKMKDRQLIVDSRNIVARRPVSTESGF